MGSEVGSNDLGHEASLVTSNSVGFLSLEAQQQSLSHKKHFGNLVRL